MNEHPPYIKLWRQYRNHRHWYLQQHRAATESEAWIDLLMDAAFKDHSIYFKGRLFHLKIGQLVTSERDLADQWKWPKTKVRRFLNDCNSCSEVDRQVDRGVSLITIVGLRRYADIGKGQRTTERTTLGPVSDHARTTIEEGKEVEKVDNTTSRMGDDASNLYHVFQCATGRLAKPPTREERELCVAICTEAPWQELGKVVTATVRKAGHKVSSIRYCEQPMRERIHELRKTEDMSPEIAKVLATAGKPDPLPTAHHLYQQPKWEGETSEEGLASIGALLGKLGKGKE